MKKLALVIPFALALPGCAPDLRLQETCGDRFCLDVTAVQTVELGAVQGVTHRDERVWIYSDADTGLLQAFDEPDENGFLEPTAAPISLAVDGIDVAPHPTGLTAPSPWGTFLGSTVHGDGTIFSLDWDRLVESGSFAESLLTQTALPIPGGLRPELVHVGGRPLLANAGYLETDNELRLLDPARIAEDGEAAVVASFGIGAFVQNLHYLAEDDVLILAQNHVYGDGWRLTFLDLSASVAAGSAQVLDVLDPELPGELEGISMIDGERVVLVSNGVADNVYSGTLTERRSARGGASY